MQDLSCSPAEALVGLLHQAIQRGLGVALDRLLEIPSVAEITAAGVEGLLQKAVNKVPSLVP